MINVPGYIRFIPVDNQSKLKKNNMHPTLERFSQVASCYYRSDIDNVLGKNVTKKMQKLNFHSHKCLCTFLSMLLSILDRKAMLPIVQL